MTSKGLVVVEQEEDVASAASTSEADLTRPDSRVSAHARVDSRTEKAAAAAAEGDSREVKRSPIGELLYMRWLEGLKLKWPSIL
jgi:serine/threonine-protein kinase 24/25/MST4